MTNSQFSWHHLNQWQIAVFPTALMVIAGLAYLFAARRAPNWPRSRTLLFTLGLVVTFLGTQSVIGVYDHEYFSIHMVEHLLLIMVAAPLFAAGRPLELAIRAGGGALHRALNSRVMRLILHPLVGFGLYFIFIPITHLTGFFNLMMDHEWLHHVEEIGFLVVGYLFFRPALDADDGGGIHPGLRLVYVMAAVPVDTFTGLALAMSSHNPFPAYNIDAPAGSTPTSILDNVHLGGAIMWIGGDALMLLICVPIALAWVRYETRRTRELDRELDAQGL
jgi:putative membrane protein